MQRQRLQEWTETDYADAHPDPWRAWKILGRIVAFPILAVLSALRITYRPAEIATRPVRAAGKALAEPVVASVSRGASDIAETGKAVSKGVATYLFWVIAAPLMGIAVVVAGSVALIAFLKWLDVK